MNLGFSLAVKKILPCTNPCVQSMGVSVIWKLTMSLLSRVLQYFSILAQSVPLSFSQDCLQSSIPHQTAIYTLLFKVLSIYYCTKKLYLVISQGSYFLDSIILPVSIFEQHSEKRNLVMILINCAVAIMTTM